MAKQPPSIDDFTKMVGEILTIWGQVEYAHCALFQVAAAGVHGNSAIYRAYWAITAFEAKQKMVDAALRDAFEKHAEYLAIWNNLNNRLIAKNRVRNKVAHGTVVPILDDKGIREVSFAPYFWPNMEKFVGMTNGAQNHMDINDLKQIAESLGELNSEIWKFRERYVQEQIMPRSLIAQDGVKELPSFHRPESPIQ